MIPPEGFDRLRRRDAAAGAVPAWPLQRSGGSDPEGKRALFSAVEQPPTLGTVTIVCSRCGTHSVVGARQALRLAMPSVHLPLMRRHASWIRCPACRRRSWVRIVFGR